MARVPVELGQSFHKTGSPWVVWILVSFNESTDPVHVRLVKLDDPTTHITLSIDVVSDPRHFQRAIAEV